MRRWFFNLVRRLWLDDVRQFVIFAERSGLISPAEIDKECASCDVDRFATDTLDRMCEQDIEKGVLTRWQCDKLRQGKWNGFFLDNYCFLEQIGKDKASSTYLVREMSTCKLMAMAVTPVRIQPLIDGKPSYKVRDLSKDSGCGDYLLASADGA